MSPNEDDISNQSSQNKQQILNLTVENKKLSRTLIQEKNRE